MNVKNWVRQRSSFFMFVHLFSCLFNLFHVHSTFFMFIQLQNIWQKQKFNINMKLLAHNGLKKVNYILKVPKMFAIFTLFWNLKKLEKRWMNMNRIEWRWTQLKQHESNDLPTTRLRGRLHATMQHQTNHNMLVKMTTMVNGYGEQLW